MNARVPPVPSRTSANTINTGIFISTSLTVVPDTVQVNRWADEPEMNAQKFLEEPQAGRAHQPTKNGRSTHSVPRHCTIAADLSAIGHLLVKIS